MRASLLLLPLAIALSGCPGDETATFDLVETSGSGVTGTVTLMQTSGKAGLGELRWSFEATDPMARTLVGFVHLGRCAKLENATHPNAIENDGFGTQLHAGGEGRPVGGETIDKFRDDYAFAVHDASTTVDPSTETVACADL